MLRKCIDCGIEVNTESELELFVKKSDAKYGRKNICKKCNAERHRERYSKAYEAKRVRPEGHREEHRRKFNGENGRKTYIKWAYGIETQDIKDYCEICGITKENVHIPKGWKSGLVVDHCHYSGKTRGTLCYSCNTALGHYENRDKLFKNLNKDKTMSYLEKYGSIKV